VLADVAAVAQVVAAAAVAVAPFWLLHKVQASDNNKFIIANSSHECV